MHELENTIKATVYKKDNKYFHRDTFHKGKSAHLEVYNLKGEHLGEAYPLTGELIINTADKTKRLWLKMIKLNKKHEKNFLSNDIYILEPFYQDIFITSDEQNLFLLNLDLALVNQFDLNESVYIYYIYKHFDNKKLLLYCPDEKKLIFIEVSKQKVSHIDIKNLIEILSPFYYWINDHFIIASYTNSFYKIDLQKNEIEQISSTTVKDNFSLYYCFWNTIVKDKSLYQIDSKAQSFICKNDNKIIFVDYLHDAKVSVEEPFNNYHDIIYFDKIFAFIKEEEIKILFDKQKIELFPDSLYIFLKACFIKENNNLFLIVLSSNKSNSKMNKIINYEIILNQ